MPKRIEQRIADIESRNRRVEADKAWETSWTRRIFISFMTYIFIAGFLITIGNDSPFMNALVPVIGFMLSTLVLTRIKARWQSKYSSAKK